MPRRLLVTLLLAVSACIPSSSGPTETTGATTIPTTSAVSGTDTTTLAPAGEEAPSPALLAQIEELEEVTEQIRGLEFLEAPRVTALTPAQLAERVHSLIEEELEEDQVEVDQALLVLLGLLEQGTDLRRLYLDLYTEQVAGFYDGDTRELVVPRGESELSPLNKMTLVHELIHALTDQHFRFHERFVRLDEEERFDEASAYQAVIEGDATFYQLIYLQDLPRSEQLEAATEALAQETAVFDRAPRFLRDLLLFPYDTGHTFVSDLVGRQGRRALDAAYQEPPVTTEQVIHPDKFFSGEEGVAVSLPATEPAGYEAVEESVWGELGFRVMLAHSLGLSEAVPAAAGWGGDRYRVLWDGERVAMVLRYRGDTEGDAAELFETMLAFVGTSMAVSEQFRSGEEAVLSGPDAYVFLRRSGDELVFVAAADSGAGEELRRAFE